MRGFDEVALGAILQGLDKRHRLPFIASCGERVSPFYEAFARQDNVPHAQVLRHALDTVWRVVIGADVPEFHRAEVERRLAYAAPDSDRAYRSPFAPQAADAVDIVTNAYAVRGERSNEDEDSVRRAVDSAMIARGTIDAYLALATLPEFVPMDMVIYRKHSKIDYAGALMALAEVQKQNDDLSLLQSSIAVDDQVVSSLRTRGSWAFSR